MNDNDRPYLKLDDEDSFFDSESVVSSTECTGLMYAPPTTPEEAESYSQIYEIPHSKDRINNGIQHE